MPRVSELKRTYLPVLAILLPSLAAVLAAWWTVSSQADALERARFDTIAHEAVSEIENRLDAYEQVLRSGVALLEASRMVTRKDWRRFVERLEVDRRYPGLQGFGYAMRLRPDQVARHEDRVRAEGFPHYGVKPAGRRDVYYPIVFLEPLADRNLRAFGYDMFSEPVRAAAMALARDTGAPAMSGRVILVQETEENIQAGALLYLPYYGPQGDPGSITGRREAIRGFVYSPFRMDDLFAAILGDRGKSLCVWVYDQEVEADSLLYGPEGCAAGRFQARHTITVGARNWVVRLVSTPALDRTVADRHSGPLALSGLIIAALLLVATRSMAIERRRRLALADSNRALDTARRQAEAANASKTRFLAAASHDLRQPLQTLGIYLHLLADQGPPHLRILADPAVQAFDAARRMLNSLLDIAALESGALQQEPQPLDAADLLARVAAESRAEAAGKGLDLRLRLAPAPVRTDPVSLERVVRNLVNNAIKYTDRGIIRLACRVVGDQARIVVSDTGRGIPADRRELIFEDFYQLGNPERDPSKGLGLGLATVSRLARLGGYRLRLRSRPGCGSSFIVELPHAPHKSDQTPGNAP